MHFLFIFISLLCHAADEPTTEFCNSTAEQLIRKRLHPADIQKIPLTKRHLIPDIEELPEKIAITPEWRGILRKRYDEKSKELGGSFSVVAEKIPMKYKVLSNLYKDGVVIDRITLALVCDYFKIPKEEYLSALKIGKETRLKNLAYDNPVTNTAVANILKGMPIQEVLNRIAPNKRKQDILVKATDSSKVFLLIKPDRLDGVLKRVKKIDSKLAEKINKNTRYQEESYSTVEKKSIPGMICFKIGEETHVLHPERRDAEVILADVLARLQNLKVSADKNSTYKDFARCVRAFFVANMYGENTFAVAESLFGAYYQTIFGKKMPPLPAEVTHLTTFASDYVYDLTKKLR